jgi:hypothetical protein
MRRKSASVFFIEIECFILRFEYLMKFLLSIFLIFTIPYQPRQQDDRHSQPSLYEQKQSSYDLIRRLTLKSSNLRFAMRHFFSSLQNSNSSRSIAIKILGIVPFFNFVAKSRGRCFFSSQKLNRSKTTLRKWKSVFQWNITTDPSNH